MRDRLRMRSMRVIDGGKEGFNEITDWGEDKLKKKKRESIVSNVTYDK